MIEKDPSLWTWGAWIPIAVMASAGGVVNWIFRVRRGQSRPFSFVELIGEMFTSGFVGLGVAMAMASFDYDFLMCAAAAGMSGHMATRLLYRVEQIIMARLERMAEERAPRD